MLYLIYVSIVRNFMLNEIIISDASTDNINGQHYTASAIVFLFLYVLLKYLPFVVHQQTIAAIENGN